jgi:hypothetical protein
MCTTPSCGNTVVAAAGEVFENPDLSYLLFFFFLTPNYQYCFGCARRIVSRAEGA